MAKLILSVELNKYILKPLIVGEIYRLTIQKAKEMNADLILGIETSCDETATALFDSNEGLIAHKVYSQVNLHRDYGGVVPELASRDHISKLLPMVDHLLVETDNMLTDIKAIAYTAGPGLSGALLVGSVTANALAYSLNIPSIPVHHMEAHLLAPLLESEQTKMPFVALLVSGGHTLLVHVKERGDYQLIGQTLDDAAGEAFDKASNLMGLGYPGGPSIAKEALSGHPDVFEFPRPMMEPRDNLDFSFSGLKTSLLYTVKQLKKEKPLDKQCIADLAYAYQEAIVDCLVEKSKRAVNQMGVDSIIIAGGVGANIRLRDQMKQVFNKAKVDVSYPSIEFCTDNAAMIALTGCFMYQDGNISNDYEININPRWSIEKIYS